MFKPQITESESRELIHDSYITYITTQFCATCGATETYSQTYEVWLHPTKTRSSNLRDLRPVSGTVIKKFGMAVLKRAARPIPVCQHCAVNTISTADPTLTQEAWQETLRRKYAPPSAEPKVAKQSASGKIIPTLDQI